MHLDEYSKQVQHTLTTHLDKYSKQVQHTLTTHLDKHSKQVQHDAPGYIKITFKVLYHILVSPFLNNRVDP